MFLHSSGEREHMMELWLELRTAPPVVGMAAWERSAALAFLEERIPPFASWEGEWARGDGFVGFRRIAVFQAKDSEPRPLYVWVGIDVQEDAYPRIEKAVEKLNFIEETIVVGGHKVRLREEPAL